VYVVYAYKGGRGGKWDEVKEEGRNDRKKGGPCAKRSRIGWKSDGSMCHMHLLMNGVRGNSCHVYCCFSLLGEIEGEGGKGGRPPPPLNLHPRGGGGGRAAGGTERKQWRLLRSLCVV
jgi:hypothetical protein